MDKIKLINYFKDVIGQKELCQKFSLAIEGNKLHHGYIFSGLRGVGKEALAIELMKIHNCESSDCGYCGECKSCRDLQALSSEDLLYIQPPYKESEKSGDYLEFLGRELAKKGEQKGYYKCQYPNSGIITIEQIKEIREFARFSSLRNSAQFILINPADGMNKESQNALLKILEEPPANFHFILICENINSLLPTILSRCQVVNFPSLTINDLSLYLDLKGFKDLEKRQIILEHANGSVDNLLKLISVEGQELLDLELFGVDLFNQSTPPQTLTLIDELLKRATDQEFPLNELFQSIFESLLQNIRTKNIGNKNYQQTRLSAYFSSVIYLFERNINPKLLIINTYLTYREEIKKWKINL